MIILLIRIARRFSITPVKKMHLQAFRTHFAQERANKICHISSIISGVICAIQSCRTPPIWWAMLDWKLAGAITSSFKIATFHKAMLRSCKQIRGGEERSASDAFPWLTFVQRYITPCPKCAPLCSSDRPRYDHLRAYEWKQIPASNITQELFDCR